MEAGKGRSSLLSRRRRAVPGAAVFFVFAAAARAQDAGYEPISVLGVKNPFLHAAANDAVSLAIRKLEAPSCQRIFTDFRDDENRTLQSRLDEQGRTGAGFLRILRFANGERQVPCQRSGVLASTSPHSHVIFLCGVRFFEREHRDPEFAAALVIHETLHALGLRENPPSSNEITLKVIERCGPGTALDTPPAPTTFLTSSSLPRSESSSLLPSQQR